MPIRTDLGGNAKGSILKQYYWSTLVDIWGCGGGNGGVGLAFPMAGSRARLAEGRPGLAAARGCVTLFRQGCGWERWEENGLALCLRGHRAILKRVKGGVFQHVPGAGERNWNRLQVFPTGSCQTRNAHVSLSGGCRHLSGRSELGLQLNYNVNPLQWHTERFLQTS